MWFGFEVKAGRAGAFRTINALNLSIIANNLGDAKSLVTHPSTTTHQRLTPEARAELGISEGFVRFSAGLEHRDDLIEDFLAALAKARGPLTSTDVIAGQRVGAKRRPMTGAANE